MLGKAWQQEGKALLHIACAVRKQRVEEKECMGSTTISCVPETHTSSSMVPSLSILPPS